jgi:hypothetical protein
MTYCHRHDGEVIREKEKKEWKEKKSAKPELPSPQAKSFKRRRGVGIPSNR